MSRFNLPSVRVERRKLTQAVTGRRVSAPMHITLANCYGALVPMDKLIAVLDAETDPKRVAKFAKACEAAKKIDANNDERTSYWGEAGIWSTRRLGQLLKRGKEEGTLREGRRPKKLSHDGIVTLKELDLTLNESSRSQAIGRVAEDAIRKHIRAVRDSGKIVTKACLAPLLNDQRVSEPPKKIVEIPGFPKGPFRAIVLDPPWPIEKIMFQRRLVEKRDMDYPTMTLNQIKELPVGKLADSRGTHIYLWITHHLLPYGFELFNAWGVRYECLLTWNKPTAQPLWWRFLTEHCLFGKIGSLAPRKKGQAVSFSAPQQKHSHKPEVFYDLVRTVSPTPRLTMFDYERAGFQQWGVTH